MKTWVWGSVVGVVVLAGAGWFYQHTTGALAASHWRDGHKVAIAWLRSKGITFTPVGTAPPFTSQQAVNAALAPVLAAGNAPNTIKLEDTAFGELTDRAHHDIQGWVVRAAWLPSHRPGEPPDYGHDAIFVIDGASGQMVYMDVHCRLH